MGRHKPHGSFEQELAGDRRGPADLNIIIGREVGVRSRSDLGRITESPHNVRVDLKKGSRYDIWPFPLCQGITRDDVRQARLNQLHHLR